MLYLQDIFLQYHEIYKIFKKFTISEQVGESFKYRSDNRISIILLRSSGLNAVAK